MRVCVRVCACLSFAASHCHVQLVKFLVAQADALLANGSRDLLMLTNRHATHYSHVARPATHANWDEMHKYIYVNAAWKDTPLACRVPCHARTLERALTSENCRDDGSCLHAAANEGRKEIVQELLSCGEVELLQLCNNSGLSVAHTMAALVRALCVVTTCVRRSPLRVLGGEHTHARR